MTFSKSRLVALISHCGQAQGEGEASAGSNGGGDQIQDFF